MLLHGIDLWNEVIWNNEKFLIIETSVIQININKIKCNEFYCNVSFRSCRTPKYITFLPPVVFASYYNKQ